MSRQMPEQPLHTQKQFLGSHVTDAASPLYILALSYKILEVFWALWIQQCSLN